MNKQIEEMAKDIRLNMQIQPNPNEHPSHQLARLLVQDGYRKSTDVAREIFEEIDTLCDKYPTIRTLGGKTFADLRKKYESEGADK